MKIKAAKAAKAVEIDALKKVIKYLYKDELESYLRSGDKGNHIFLDVQVLDIMLKRITGADG